MVNGLCFDKLNGSLEAEWSAIRDYFAFWHDCQMGDQLADLPVEFTTSSTAIQEWSRLVRNLQESQMVGALRDNIVIRNVPEHDAIGFLWQCEGDFIWAIDKAHWQTDNPEVLGFVLDYDASEMAFIPLGQVATSLSEFALTHSSHFMRRTFANARVRAPDDPAWIKEMRSSFSVIQQLGKTQIFESPGIIAIISPDSFERDSMNLYIALKHSDALNLCPDTCLNLLKNGGSFAGHFGEDSFRQPKRTASQQSIGASGRTKPFWKIW